MHEGFTDLVREFADMKFDIRYAGCFNFVGVRVDGYTPGKCFFTFEGARALEGAFKEAKAMGFGMLVWDAYRPMRACRHFERWAADIADARMKEFFYPDLDKKLLYEKGYIATYSGHSRGSSIDLTLTREGVPLDMGGTFDLFSQRSAHYFEGVTAEQKANRELLKSIMLRHGFAPYSEEWWHYSLVNEPFTNEYFDFVQ